MKKTGKETVAAVGKRNGLRGTVKRVIAAILLTVVMFSVAEVITYFDQMAAADRMQNEILDELVTPNEEVTEEPVVPEEEEIEEVVEEEEVKEEVPEVVYTPDPETITVDFAELTARYPDVVGYIYGANTRIQYPIAYTPTSNDYYLNRDLDGNLNANGSIFIEHLCAPDFSNHNTILYGHHMKSGLMFAGLVKYKDQSYYDAHPYFYIYTPTQDYKLNLFAGFVCAHDDEVFALSLTQSQLEGMAAKSTFRSNIGTPTGNVVTLCTCSYEFNNARYVVVGELVPIEG